MRKSNLKSRMVPPTVRMAIITTVKGNEGFGTEKGELLYDGESVMWWSDFRKKGQRCS